MLTFMIGVVAVVVVCTIFLVALCLFLSAMDHEIALWVAAAGCILCLGYIVGPGVRLLLRV